MARCLGFGPRIESFLLRGSAGDKEIAGPGHRGTWGRAGWEKLLCPAYWSGSTKREVLSCPGGEGGYQMVSVPKPSPVYSALQPAFS